MRPASRWLVLASVLAVSGCGGGQVSPRQEQPHRFADYDGTSTPAGQSQCELPVAQRDEGWFCPEVG